MENGKTYTEKMQYRDNETSSDMDTRTPICKRRRGRSQITWKRSTNNELRKSGKELGRVDSPHKEE